MKLGALFSGGKDSTYAMYLAQRQGHEISCLITLDPKSADSHLLHHPNVKWTKLQADSMGLPQFLVNLDSIETNDELDTLNDLIKKAKHDFDIEGLVNGGIKSVFQKERFESICKINNLESITPLWKLDSQQYMNELIENNFEFILTSVSADGLDDSWLGKVITKNDVVNLEKLSQKYGFNSNFEGGEAETFVLNCPMFEYPISIIRSENIWDGYRGRFEIVEAGINYNA